MNIATMIVTVLGLGLFEVVSSIDNAVINAEVLSTMSPKGRRWFLLWGLLGAVFIIRGLLPWMIIWLATPGISAFQALIASFSSNHQVQTAIEVASPVLLVGGGVFLIFLFAHWLFLEPKNFGLRGERFFHKNGIWFYAVVSVMLTAIVWFSIKINPIIAFGAVVGSTVFFVTSGFKSNAESAERKLTSGEGHLSDLSKILYLEIIDATFSIDGVLGAFAFTLSVPLILIGNGLGAYVLRKLTVSNIDNIKKYVYLKNGAMYSIGVLGVIMTATAFGVHIPEITSPIATFIIVGYFFLKSKSSIKSA
ncbi:MAG: DUF475 domain-containing protein [bacterium]